MNDMQKLYYLNLIIKKYLEGYQYLILVDNNFKIFRIELLDTLKNDKIIKIIEVFKNELKNNHYRFI